MSSPTLIIGDGNWAVKSGLLLGYEYGELSGQFAPIPITGSRASIATYTDQSGLIVSASSGVLRVDYSTGTGSLLLEPQRTNLALYSEQFDNAYWTKTDITLTQNDAISPDGYQNADLITTGVANSDQISRTITLAATNTITQSVFIKRVGGADWVDFIALRSGFANSVKVWFNITTGEVGGNILSGTVSLNSASIENYGNGWLRLIVTTTDSTNNTNFDTRLRTANADRSDTRVNNSSYYLWGAQLEEGAYPTTYIPTAGSTVTRLVDSFNRSNIYTDGVITSGGGTWLVELLNNILVTRDASDVGLFIGNSSNGVTGESLMIRNNGTARLAVTKRIAGSQTLLFDTTTNTVKIAMKWDGTNADVFVNGTKVVSATAFATTNMEFFRGLGADVTKYITQNKFYNQPLSDAECISLTTL